MIPIKLAVRNFMCYRDRVPPLSFEGIHVACLCGDNGHGKSALLDAMTWALWGRSRARSHDDLVHQGQMEMEVEFEFMVGGERYRVIRKYARGRPGRSGQHLLELQVAGGDGFRPISGSGLGETEEKIRSILRMDYQTFINSAFLVQGRADEFTHTLPPRERKEILARILGLSFYDELEARARGHSREKEAQRKGLEGDIIRIEEELARKPDYQAQKAQSTQALERLEREIEAQETAAAALRRERQALERKREELEEINKDIEEAKRELEQWENQVKDYQDRIEGYEQILSQRSAMEQGYARFLEAKRTDDALNEKLRVINTINQAKRPLELAVQRAREELLRELERSRSRAGELRKSYQKLPRLREELAQVQARLVELASQGMELDAKRHQAREASDHLLRLEADNIRLKEEMNSLREKLDLLAPAQARCPLCGTELSPASREQIKASYQAEGQARADTYRSQEKQMEGLRKEHRALEREAQELDARLKKELATEQARQLALEKESREAEEAGGALGGEQATLGELERRWSSGDFALAEQRELGQLETKAQELGYDAPRHQTVREELEKLKDYESLKHRLEEAQRSMPVFQAALDQAQAAASSRKGRLEEDGHRRQALEVELATLPQVTHRLGEVERELEQLGQQRVRRHDELVALEVELRRLQDREREHREKTALKEQGLEEESIYKELAEAFGKGGIQALLIEIALPEIEAEANRLLARMTDNRMHLKIDTQRARKTKKEEMAETLLINISDELGTRNYEMFSGGEAFRINFALRIALSKLLARRAGAPLPTLVIDEGFGTQDTAGREKLVEAINSIQDDFEKIIVITHIEEMKDLFPVRIDVTKTAEGSMIQVG